MIRKQYGYSDRKLVEQIIENPYYQFFVGIPGFCNESIYVVSLLVEFRKRLDDETLIEINEMILSLAKRCYGLDRMNRKFNLTMRNSIALWILTMNVALSVHKFLIILFSRFKQYEKC